MARQDRRQSFQVGLQMALDDAEDTIKSRRARMAAGGALALALDGSSFGWALGNLHGGLAWTTLVISVVTLVGATVGIAVATARIDRRLAKLRRVRRLLDLVA